MLTTRTLAALVSSICGAAASADIQPEWTTPYSAPGPFTFYEFVADDAGNTYSVATLDDDLSVTKLDPEGVFQWQTVFAGPIGQDIGAAVSLSDDQSAVYALGRSMVPGFANSDFNILKVDAQTGDILWQRFYDGGDLGIDSPQDIVGTPDGGVAACGGIDTPNEQRDYGTVKYDADGNLMWERKFTGVGQFLFENDDARFIVATPDGDVVITGEAKQGITRADCVTIKYDGQTGETIWQNAYSTPADDSSRDLKLAANGDVLVFGSDPFGIDRQWFLARFDGATGAQLWATTVDPGQDEFPASIAVGPDGSVYATGATDPDGDDSNNNENAITIAYDGDTGAVRWINEFGFEGIGDFDIGRGVHADTQGRVDVFGTTRSEPLVADPFESDALVLEFDAETGSLLDTGLIDTTTPGGPAASESVDQITTDAAGNVYTYGSYFDGTDGGELYLKFALGPAGCNPADLADPLGVLDLADVQTFIAAFTNQQPAADLDGNGVYDLADVQAFIAAFTAGCP